MKGIEVMMKKILFFCMLAAMTLPVKGGDISGSITVNGAKREYMGYLPNNLGAKRPLLISCHGYQQDAAYQKNMLKIESVADTAKFLTIFPQGEGSPRAWDISGDKDINFVKAIIDAMVDKYDIDPSCVYLSGFSMGGMFTYHAMNKIPDLIAAFAPISGYSLNGTTANANVRPLPIIHTHGTGDDVVNFGGVQGALDVWIKHNGCPTTAKVTKKYRGASHITRHVWGPGNDNVEVVLMEMADKGHWISNDNGVLTGDEIWKFCKRYSLHLTKPSVRITTPKSGLTFVTIGGQAEVPDITVKATATDPDGTVEKVELYDGNTLITTFEKAPYSYTLSGLGKGTHNIRVVATDNEGNTGSSVITLNVVEGTSHSLHTSFKTEGSVPEGWSTYDCGDTRNGFSSGYSSGPRLFHFTGAQHDFEWGLYTRNSQGQTKGGYARYGGQGTTVMMHLYPGQYQLRYRVSNWNRESFSPVTVALETLAGKQVFVQQFTPTSNIGNAASNSFSGTTLEKNVFNVTQKSRYVMTFYTADDAWADLVVGQVLLQRLGDIPAAVDGIETNTTVSTTYYTLSGQVAQPSQRGALVEKTVDANGKVKSRVIIRK